MWGRISIHSFVYITTRVCNCSHLLLFYKKGNSAEVLTVSLTKNLKFSRPDFEDGQLWNLTQSCNDSIGRTIWLTYFSLSGNVPAQMHDAQFANHCRIWQITQLTFQLLKVIKFWKQIFLFSFEPKNERHYFLISALASKNGSNQKNGGTLLY